MTLLAGATWKTGGGGRQPQVAKTSPSLQKQRNGDNLEKLNLANSLNEPESGFFPRVSSKKCVLSLTS